MIVDITRLRSGIVSEIPIDFTYTFNVEELKGTGASSINDVKINGIVSLNALKELYINIEITGMMIIPCAITLKPVEYPFECFIDGDLDEIIVEFDKNIKKNQNTLDIFPIIWENILMEIPMRVVSEEAKDYEVHGDGWKLITDDCENNQSELSKLKDLL